MWFNKIKTLVIFCLMILNGIWANGQGKNEISGIIRDKENNQVLSGVLVYTNSEQVFVTSSPEGTFSIEVNDKHKMLFFERMGYDKIEVLISGIEGKYLEVDMELGSTILEEILIFDRNLSKVNQKYIDPDQIIRSNPKDVGDMFENVSGFGLIKRGAYAMDPVYRSFKYDQLNLIYDGGVYISNACPNRMDPASTHVSPSEVKSIELIKGPYSVRYGQTMGAILNINTNKPRYSDTFSFSGDIEGGYEFNGNGISGRAALNASNKNYDLSVQGGLMDYDDYKSGDGTTVPSAFKTYDYAVKFGYALKTNQRLQLNWRQSFGRDIKHASLPMDLKEDNSSMLSLDYGLNRPGENLTSFSAKGFYTYVDHLMTNEYRPNYSAVEANSPVTSTTYGMRGELGWNIGLKGLMYTGIDYRYVGKDGQRERLVKVMNGNPLPQPMEFIDLIWQDSWSNNVGAFAEYQNDFLNNLSLVVGTRVDFVSSGADNPAEDFMQLYGDVNPDNTVTGSINGSLRYLPAKDWLLLFSIGRGTRSPDLLERYINHFNIGMDGYEYVGDPNLKPEVNNQTDLAATWTKGKFSINANVFYSIFENYISAKVDSTLHRKYMPTQEPVYAKRFINIGKGRQYGFDAGITYKILDNLKLSGEVFYTRADNLDFDEPLPEIPPFTGLFSLRYEKSILWAEFRGKIAAEQDRIASSFGETATPGFQVFDILFGYSPIKSLTIKLNVKNIFNENYYEHLSRPYSNQGETGMFYEPGRSVLIGLKFNF